MSRVYEQRGVALIMAVLMVALATMLAVSVATEGYMDQRRNATLLLLDQAYEMGLGAEALAAETLRDDAAGSKVDTPGESWATPIVLPIDEGAGEIKGSLEDLQGRFNLNKLLNDDGSKNAEAVAQFERLLELLNIDRKWAMTTLDWIDADNNQETDGAEDSVYAGRNPAYLTANMVITRTSELFSAVGMDLSIYRKLEPYVATLPNHSSLNVCTASALVLDSLSGTLTQYSNNATTFVSNRENGCFPSLNEIRNSFANDPAFARMIQQHPDYLVETSNYFRASILVTIGTTELALYSVLNRTGNANNARVRVIQRSFGTT